MDLEKIGLSPYVYVKIKKLSNGDSVSFTDDEIQQIKKDCYVW